MTETTGYRWSVDYRDDDLSASFTDLTLTQDAWFRDHAIHVFSAFNPDHANTLIAKLNGLRSFDIRIASGSQSKPYHHRVVHTEKQIVYGAKSHKVEAHTIGESFYSLLKSTERTGYKCSGKPEVAAQQACARAGVSVNLKYSGAAIPELDVLYQDGTEYLTFARCVALPRCRDRVVLTSHDGLDLSIEDPGKFEKLIVSPEHFSLVTDVSSALDRYNVGGGKVVVGWMDPDTFTHRTIDVGKKVGETGLKHMSETRMRTETAVLSAMSGLNARRSRYKYQRVELRGFLPNSERNVSPTYRLNCDSLSVDGSIMHVTHEIHHGAYVMFLVLEP